MDTLNDLLEPMAAGVGLLAGANVWILAVIGVIYGVFAAAMPGFGTVLAYGLVLPFTFAMEPTQAVALLLSITVAMGFGNSIPAILLSVPGTPAAVLTAVDGFALHKQGKSGLALGTSFISALAGQLISIPFFVILVVPLSGLAYVFLPSELFALYLLGMVAIVSLTGKNVLKGLAAAAFGLTVAYIGLDPMNSTPRFVFMSDLRNGLETAPVVIGLLAVSELFRQARQTFRWDAVVEGFSARFPSWSEIRRTMPAMAGGTVVGTLVGAIPGASGTPAALISYQQAQLFSKHPEEFGEGSVEGIAANEAAQNASNSGELIPTLGLGIPGSGSMVLLLASLQVHGMVPGPLLTQQSPELMHAAVAGMLAATVILALVGWWISKSLLRALTVDRSIVIILALALIVVGTFSLRYEVLDVVTTLVFGAIGYFMTRYGYSVAAAALAIVLASGFESTLRQGLNLYDNNWVEFFTRPVTAVIVLAALAFLAVGIRRTVKFRRAENARLDEANQEGS